ncbi:MAG: hypothetical protein A2X94_13210 [Bdellovibrionales bacterium GWB1_55_8]|nr:MAG: hypothetical protein A2X94_13210 [Bdellovibrionales bacterium GWB1_55_8]
MEEDRRKRKCGQGYDKVTPLGISKPKLMRLMGLDHLISQKVVRKYLEEASKTYAPESLRSFAQRHYEWMQERNYSPMTVYVRADLLTRFFDWCEERGVTELSQVTPGLVEHFQTALTHRKRRDGEPISVHTQIKYLTNVSCFFRWCVRRKLISFNPSSDLELPRAPGRQFSHEVLSEREIQSVMAIPDTGTAEGLRDRAILEVLYSTGIRRIEVSGLTIESMDREHGTLKVRGKGQKDRMVPIGERALQWVDRYVTQAREKLWTGKVVQDPGHLFIGPMGGGINIDYVSKRVGMYLHQAGIKKPGCCHLFRHAMATHLLERGADMRYIQLMLGHANLSTTEIYTSVSIQKLKEVHTTFHPGANLQAPKAAASANRKRLKVVG